MLAERGAEEPDYAIDALLRRWLPGRLVAFTRATSGGSTPVYQVTTEPDRRRYFLRLAEEPGEHREAEVRVHHLLSAAGLPVPAIVAWESSPPELDRAATLTAAIPGRPMCDSAGLDATTSATVARAAGRDLARINRVPVRGFGWVRGVDAADGSLIAEHPSRAAWIAEYADALTMVIVSGIIPPPAALRLRGTIERWLARPNQTTSHLAHGDFDATHIYLTHPAGRYSGIIDFGEIRGADLLYDLGHALLQGQHLDSPPLLPGFLTGYAEVTPLPSDPSSAIREQAAAIGARQLAIFLRRHDWGRAARLARQLAAVPGAEPPTP